MAAALHVGAFLGYLQSCKVLDAGRLSQSMTDPKLAVWTMNADLMSTTEVSQTKLDVQWLDHEKLETENRRLLEVKLQGVLIINIEKELTQTHEKCATWVGGELITGASTQFAIDQADKALAEELRKTIATLEGKMAMLQGTLEEMDVELREGEKELEESIKIGAGG